MRLNIIAMLAFLFMACQQGQPRVSSEHSVKEITQAPAIQHEEIIRNPVTANAQLDSSTLAQLSFEENSYNFGEVEEGTIVEHAFPFTNNGAAPLLITDARSTCGCTVPNYPEEVIPPGGQGVLKVRFDTDGKMGKQRKPVTVFANTLPNQTRVHLVGTVREPSNQ